MTTSEISEWALKQWSCIPVQWRKRALLHSPTSHPWSTALLFVIQILGIKERVCSPQNGRHKETLTGRIGCRASLWHRYRTHCSLCERFNRVRLAVFPPLHTDTQTSPLCWPSTARAVSRSHTGWFRQHSATHETTKPERPVAARCTTPRNIYTQGMLFVSSAFFYAWTCLAAWITICTWQAACRWYTVCRVNSDNVSYSRICLGNNALPRGGCSDPEPRMQIIQPPHLFTSLSTVSKLIHILQKGNVWWWTYLCCASFFWLGEHVSPCQ